MKESLINEQKIQIVPFDKVETSENILFLENSNLDNGYSRQTKKKKKQSKKYPNPYDSYKISWERDDRLGGKIIVFNLLNVIVYKFES